MTPTLVTILGFFATVLTFAAVYSLLSDLFFRHAARVNRRLDDEFRTTQRERAKKSTLFKVRHKIPTEGAGNTAKVSPRQRVEALIEQSGLALDPQQLLAFSAAGALILGGLAGWLRHSLVVGLILGLVGASLPLMYVSFKRKVRLDKFLEQLPDAFDLMGRVLRAGQTVPQAMLAVADEFSAPIAGEFVYCSEQQNLGLAPEIAYRDLAQRNGLLELKIFVMALLVQQQTGGNLAELLENLANVTRERFRLKGKVKAITAEGRMQAAVLLALPPFMLVMLMVVSYDYVKTLFEEPNLLYLGLLSMGLGALWIRKIVNFDF